MAETKKTRFFLRLGAVAAGLLFIFLLVAVRGSGENERPEGGEKLQVLEEFTIPLREISGLTRTATEILAIGDDDPLLGVLSLSHNNLELTRTVSFAASLLQNYFLCSSIHNTICRTLAHIITRQWEGIYYQPQPEQIFVLQESTGSIFVFNWKMDQILSHIVLNFFPDRQERSAKTNNSLGEGFVPLGNKRILVAKEKFPTAVIEFGEQDAEAYGYMPHLSLPVDGVTAPRQMLYPLHYWHLNTSSSCDLSDITTDREGVLYGISQICRRIYQFADLTPAEDNLKLQRTWRIPKRVSAPEALVVISDGVFLVASDTKKQGQENMFLVADDRHRKSATVSLNPQYPRQTVQ